MRKAGADAYGGGGEGDIDRSEVSDVLDVHVLLRALVRDMCSDLGR